MKCKNCGKELQESWQICPFCMTKIEQEIHCPKCGMKLEKGWLACPGCATPTSGGSTPRQSTPISVSGNDRALYSHDLSGSGSGEDDVRLAEIVIPPNSELGRYKVIRKIGQGGYGAVFEGIDTFMPGNKMALKVMPLLGTNTVQSLMLEYNTRRRIRNQEDIMMADKPEPVEWQGQQFVVYPMELAEGGSLREKLPQLKKIEEPKKKEKQIIDYFLQMCRGVSLVHEAGIIHLDIKPENFLFHDGKLKVTDFGISRNLQKADVDVSQLQEGIGTGPYMAPEQHETANPLDVDERADIYALGVIFYEMLAGGKRPYEGKGLGEKKRKYYPPKKLRQIEAGYWQIIVKCLDPDFEERFQSVAELITAVETGNKAEMEKLKKYQTLLDKVSELEPEENYNEAVKALNQAFKLYPDKIDESRIIQLQDQAKVKAESEAAAEKKRQITSLLQQGNALLKSQNYQGAISRYKEVLRLKKDHATAKANLQEAYNKQAEYEAKEAGKAAFRKKIEGIFQEAENSGYYENYEEALGFYDQILKLDQGNNKAKRAKANAEKKLKEQKTRVEQEKKDALQRKANLVSIEGGTFQMGSNSTYMEHKVSLSNFYIGTYAVTQQQYKEVMGTNPAKGYGAGGNYPVYNVSWYDAVEFCNKLSERDGLQKSYSGSGDNIKCNFSANGYRLPTEAEWEYAARGGNNSRGYEYSGSNNVDEVAEYAGNHGKSTRPVGGKNANELGLFDMSGNVWEWCWDCFEEYSSSSQTNPCGPSSGSDRVFRGGSWNYDASSCRVALRGYCTPGYRICFIGFRLARSSR